MPSLKDLRNRIASVKATQKITRAMQMVAASRLRRAQEAVEAGRPYIDAMDRLIARVVRAQGKNDAAMPPLLAPQPGAGGAPERVVLLVMTAERGLCGGFNASIVRAARLSAARLAKDGKAVQIYCVGKKGYDALKREFDGQIVETVSLRGSDTGAGPHRVARKVSADLRARFERGEFDTALLFFSAFKSVIVQEPRTRQLIPVLPPQPDTLQDAPGAAQAAKDGLETGTGADVCEFEPGPQEVLEELGPGAVTAVIHAALLENAASEQGARMTAMDNATRNAGEMIDRLALSYNRQRQAQITRELIEIISGAEAL